MIFFPNVCQVDLTWKETISHLCLECGPILAFVGLFMVFSVSDGNGEVL